MQTSSSAHTIKTSCLYFIADRPIAPAIQRMQRKAHAHSRTTLAQRWRSHHGSAVIAASLAKDLLLGVGGGGGDLALELHAAVGLPQVPRADGSGLVPLLHHRARCDVTAHEGRR